MKDERPEVRYYPASADLTFPPLSAEEELAMFRKALKGDAAARETLITRHLLVALKLGRRFSGNKLPVDETTSVANLALMKAIDRFDPERGFRFRSFLMPYVRAAIATCWRERAPVDFKHSTPPVEVPIDNIPEGKKVPEELIQNPTVEQEDHDAFLKGELARCAETLCDRDKLVLKLYYVDGYNNAEIGRQLKLSRESIRLIHDRVLSLLKDRLEKRGIRRTQ